MKRRIHRAMLIPLLAVLCIVMSSCAPDKQRNETISMQALYDTITRGAALPDMVTLDSASVEDYYGISQEMYTDYVCYAATDGLLADEVMLIRAKDQAVGKQISALLADHLVYRQNEMRDYLPEQYALLQDATLAEKDLVIALIVSSDGQKINSAFQKALP